MAYIEHRRLEQRDKSGRTKSVVRYKVRYRDAAGKPHTETKRRLVDAERRKAEIELDVGNGLWRDPRRGEIRLEKWAADWIQTRHDLRLTTRTRLEITLKVQVLPRFGSTPLVRITNAAARSWVAEMLAAGLSPSTIAKPSSRFANISMRRLLTTDWRSTQRSACRCLRSHLSRRDSSPSRRWSSWSTPCPTSTKPWCWLVPTLVCAGVRRLA